MRNKKVISLIIFSLAVLVLALGVTQMWMYISQQLNIVEEARVQGVDDQAISEFYRNQFTPQILSYIMNTLGFVSVLAAAGLISLGLFQSQGRSSANLVNSETGLDRFNLGKNSNPQSQDILTKSLDDTPEMDSESLDNSSEEDSESLDNSSEEDSESLDNSSEEDSESLDNSSKTDSEDHTEDDDGKKPDDQQQI